MGVRKKERFGSNLVRSAGPEAQCVCSVYMYTCKFLYDQQSRHSMYTANRAHQLERRN